DPPAISADEPFPVTVTIGRTTGNEKDMDKQDGPGYDTDANDDIVRTFDKVSYRVTAGISNMDDKYSGVRVRLDMELPDAWRKDKAGQIRQTAEFSNGTLTDTGNGTKKSTRSSWTTATGSATIQAFFTETIETFGGVNKDQLKPNFTLTIESATLKSGETVEINQVIDGNIKPDLNDTVYISAMPYVDVVIKQNSSKNSTFEKTTGTKDRPFTLIRPVASYVQLKPLPKRADITSIKGCTYPVGGVEYKIEQKVLYSGGAVIDKELSIGTETDPIQAIVYSPLGHVQMNDRKFTSQYSSYSSVYKPLSLQGTQAPYGKTATLSPPIPNNLVGIYDTGNPVVTNNTTDNTMVVKNTDYKPIDIKGDKYLFSSVSTPLGSNVKPFSVTAMQVIFPYEYLEKQVGVTGKLDYTLSVSEVKYENDDKIITQEVKSKELISWNKSWPGSMQSYTAFLDSNMKKLSSVEDTTNNVSSNGDGITAQGNPLYVSFYSTFTDPGAENGYLYGRWNANSFQYDDTRPIVPRLTSANITETYYGVGSKIPNDDLRKQEEIESAFTWYGSVSAAKAAGEISAVKFKYKPTSVDGYSLAGAFVPLIATGKTEKDTDGNYNIGIANAFNYDDKSGATRQSPPKSFIPPPTGDGQVKYQPSKYDPDGKIISSHYVSIRSWDTLYIAGMTIRPTISTKEKVYAPGDTVEWTVDGKVESGSENNHKVQFEVTIPKETQYIDGTAKDYQGNPLPDPSSRVKNSDGTWTLTWILDYTAEGSTYNPKVTFDTSIISSALDFDNNEAFLKGKVVAEVWLEKNESMKDPSDEKFRTSTNDFTVTNSGVVVVDKVVDKPYIESGNEIDPANPTDTHPTDFTYTISFKNHSSSAMDRVRILDVLPYNVDGRDTKFHGSYSLIQVKQLPGGVEGKIYYTANDEYYPSFNPNKVTLSSNGWKRLGSDMSVLEDARAIFVEYDKLDPGEDMSLSLTLRPKGQEAGDKYVNNAGLNSGLGEHVIGVPSTVRVYGRDLSGVAWYDDNLDGLIGNKPSGGAEEWAKDIPVKLYRTSLEVPSYKNKLVEESLTGEPFIDPSGNSLVKTNENGKYQFNNLPEGNYLAEFVIGDKVVQREFRVTKKEAGSDESLNSKADQTTYKTKDFAQPILSEVAGLGAADSKNHVEHVNLGLVRPSTIRLFKYATGTAIDGNNDGHLSEAEKATGTPLKNAEFEVYEGDASSPFAKETTDESGNLSFVKLFPGEHTLIETKAPEGYELIKSPIKVTITEGNQTIQVYQEDDKKTDLPFTGGTGPMLLLLIIVSGMGILGLGGLYWYYRQPSRKGEG
ncbi:hypothetical protein JZO77_25375, partial [Enterococcus hulanensis]|uniref:SpaA isopeptide-forming pilin-related protein n=1 Tax=Enterococcus hulanensis TaxID=2559929 RepID=UPI001A908F75